MDHTVAKAKASPDRGRLLADFLRGSRLFFLACMLCAALAALADMVMPQIIRVAVDQVLGGAPMEALSPTVRSLVSAAGGPAYLRAHLWIMALAILAVAVVKAACQYGFRVENARGSETLVKTMRDRLFNHIERLPFQWHMRHHTGDIIQRCTSDIETTRNFISEQMTGLIRILILVVMGLVFMLSMNPALTGIVSLPMPVVIGYSVWFHHQARKDFQRCDENEGKLSAMVQTPPSGFGWAAGWPGSGTSATCSAGSRSCWRWSSGRCSACGAG